MINAVGDPQRILLLGGTSEIGLAIVAEYLSHAPAEVVLACQPGDPETANAVNRVKADGAQALVTLSNVTIANNAANGVLEANTGQIQSFANNRIVGNNPNIGAGTTLGTVPQQ